MTLTLHLTMNGWVGALLWAVGLMITGFLLGSLFFGSSEGLTLLGMVVFYAGVALLVMTMLAALTKAILSG